jgi:hypothetical protein
MSVDKRHIVWMSALAIWVCGCESSSQTGALIGSDEARQTEMPRVEVKLPPPPSFKKEAAVDKYGDGSYSVYGVRNDMAANLDQEVKVTGYVVEVYECPPCPKGTECEACVKPHFWLADRKHDTRDKALMVTDYPERHPKTRKKISLKTGERLLVTGQFAKASGTGFRASDGLLVYTEHAPASESASP